MSKKRIKFMPSKATLIASGIVGVGTTGTILSTATATTTVAGATAATGALSTFSIVQNGQTVVFSVVKAGIVMKSLIATAGFTLTGYAAYLAYKKLSKKNNK